MGTSASMLLLLAIAWEIQREPREREGPTFSSISSRVLAEESEVARRCSASSAASHSSDAVRKPGGRNGSRGGAEAASADDPLRLSTPLGSSVSQRALTVALCELLDLAQARHDLLPGHRGGRLER